MQTLYPTYNDNTTLYHHTALAHLAGIMRELFCPKPPIPQQQTDQEEPEHLVIDMPTIEPHEEEYLLIHQPETILQQQHTIPHITLNQYRPLQIICNCLAKYFRKPKQKY
jgi:hypothetical protein